jgi:hypothetical protein
VSPVETVSFGHIVRNRNKTTENCNPIIQSSLKQLTVVQRTKKCLHTMVMASCTLVDTCVSEERIASIFRNFCIL